MLNKVNQITNLLTRILRITKVKTFYQVTTQIGIRLLTYLRVKSLIHRDATRVKNPGGGRQ